jgi:hypothetical protein
MRTILLCSSRSKEGSATLDAYLSHKHDKLLAKLLQPGSYRKRSSLAIVDGFAVEITEDQVTSISSCVFLLSSDRLLAVLMHIDHDTVNN